MNTKEAIKQMEQLQRFCSIRSGQSKDSAFAKDCKALEMAISALRDQKITLDRSMWDGCEWCYDEIPFDSVDMEFELQHPLEDYPRMVHPQFCPMCGRPLTKEAWAEMERRINDGTTD